MKLYPFNENAEAESPVNSLRDMDLIKDLKLSHVNLEVKDLNFAQEEQGDLTLRPNFTSVEGSQTVRNEIITLQKVKETLFEEKSC